MQNLEPNIRNAVRAIIQRDGAILMQKKYSDIKGTWFTLPGGGQDVRETLIEALQRECTEEIGVEVRVGELIHVADFYKLRETDFPSTRHLVEFLFACEVPPEYRPMNGSHPDKHQVDVVWLPVAEVTQHRLFPPGLVKVLTGLQSGESGCYLGVLD
ncbi:MAG: NUDIX domain-containing protein [Gammaproteobacteria bacterium]|nr:NUDIX domain-containing protein [Gammaproteobacteria bacterium]